MKSEGSLVESPEPPPYRDKGRTRAEGHGPGDGGREGRQRNRGSRRLFPNLVSNYR